MFPTHTTPPIGNSLNVTEKVMFQAGVQLSHAVVLVVLPVIIIVTSGNHDVKSKGKDP